MNNYHAYLIRIWRTDETGGWRASAQDPHSGKRYYFDSLEELLHFLRGQIAPELPIPSSPADAY